MKIIDDSWMSSYFAAVPKLLADYGAHQVAGARTILQVEGEMDTPDRIAAFSFPSLDAIGLFLADERYQAFKTLRQSGASSEIFIFDNSVTDDNSSKLATMA